MAVDLLERLAEVEVPPPPQELDRNVHQRVNKLLLIAHLGDLALRGLLYAFMQFMRPTAHLFVLTLTAKPLEPPRPRPSNEEEGA